MMSKQVIKTLSFIVLFWSFVACTSVKAPEDLESPPEDELQSEKIQVESVVTGLEHPKMS